jgi:hypothetical protein
MEEWKNLEGFGGKNYIYQISDQGRLRSVRTTINYLKPSKTGGYYFAHLTKNNGKSVTQYIHRLVALFFIPNPLNKPEVNHLDGNKQNNNLENLEWATTKENINHSYLIGSSKVGEDRHLAKFKNEEVRQIKLKSEAGMKIKDIAKELNLQYKTVYAVVKKRSYKTII